MTQDCVGIDDGLNGGFSAAVKWAFRVVFLGLIFPTVSAAQLLTYDSFEEYPTGQVESGPNGSSGLGLSGGLGWGGNYDVNNAIKSLVQIEDRSALPVRYDNGEIHLDGGVRALRFYDVANGSVALSRPLGMTLAVGQVLYFSFLFRTNNSSPLPAQDFIQFGFDNTANSTNPRVSIGANTESSGPPFPFHFFARTTTNPDNSSFASTPDIQAATTYLLVGRISGNPTGNFNRVDLYVNPATVLEPATTDASFMANSGASTLSHFSIRTAALDNGDGYVIDELRIGGDYPSVIPEPSTAVLLVTGVLCCYRRRPRR